MFLLKAVTPAEAVDFRSPTEQASDQLIQEIIAAVSISKRICCELSEGAAESRVARLHVVRPPDEEESARKHTRALMLLRLFRENLDRHRLDVCTAQIRSH
jgi:hypothetical protein